MKSTNLRALVGAFAFLLLNSVAIAAVKVDSAEVAKLEKIALVGYSFYREVQHEEASLFTMNPKEIELTPEDPEFIMMQAADDRVLELLQKGGTFVVIPQEEVFANALYQSSTKDPESKLVANWYFPDQFRVIKLKKKDAMALCEALGVDAVVEINFKHAGGTSGSSTMGMFSKSKTSYALAGEITMIDKNGKTMISGSAKSDKSVKRSGRSFGNEDSGIAIDGGGTEADAGEFYSGLLNSYMEELSKELGYE
jgi:hypothetical protein